MIKKIKIFTGMCAAVLMMSACSTTAPLTATSNTIGKKIGTAKATFVFGLSFGSDYSVLTAAKNGGISKVSTVDVRYFNALGIFMTRKTIVTGE